MILTWMEDVALVTLLMHGGLISLPLPTQATFHRAALDVSGPKSELWRGQTDGLEGTPPDVE